MYTSECQTLAIRMFPFTKLYFYYSDPLEQFDVFQLLPSVCYSLTNLTLFAIVNMGVFSFLLYATTYKNQSHSVTSSVLSDIIRSIYEMLAGLSESNIRLNKQVYFPILFFIFMLILVSNLVGMIPYSYTVTSSFV
jgi:F0F1-type ATP synthase membrane subunit a